MADLCIIRFLVLLLFRVVEKRGKATLICDKLSSIVEYKQDYTKVISCDENRIEESGVKIRCSKYSTRYDDYTLLIIDCDQRYYEGSATD